MLKYGQKIEVKIDKIITGGDGIAKYENIVVMVPYAVPKDKLLVEITEIKRNYARGKIVSILSPSPNRIVPPCPIHYTLTSNPCFYCGGCDFQMIKYEKQLEFKTKIVQDFFDVPIKSILPAPNPFGYRNKVQMPIGGSSKKVFMGFFHPQSHRIVDVRNCLLETQLANKIISSVRDLINEYKIQPYNEDANRGVLRHIILRQSMAFNEVMLIFVSKTNFISNLREITGKITKKFPEIVSIYHNINFQRTNVIFGDKSFKIFGKDTIREKIGNVVFEISPTSFFQVNTAQAAKLYDVIKNFANLKGTENIIDVYSGCGGITLYLAPFCKSIKGIEEVASAVADAIKNARINNIRNTYFIRGNADYTLRKMDFTKYNIVILDPPRAGCSEDVIKVLLRLKPQKIIYTSCNPATLARDVKILSQSYKINEIQPVDMFPQTSHIECVVSLVCIS